MVICGTERNETEQNELLQNKKWFFFSITLQVNPPHIGKTCFKMKYIKNQINAILLYKITNAYFEQVRCSAGRLLEFVKRMPNTN